jgi:hypothetical protein
MQQKVVYVRRVKALEVASKRPFGVFLTAAFQGHPGELLQGLPFEFLTGAAIDNNCET